MPVGPFVAAGAGAAVLAAILVARPSHRTATEEPTALASLPAASASCASSRACVESHGGEPYVCRASDRTCAPLASEDCTPTFEPNDLLADDTVWLGAMFPTKGPAAAAYGAINMGVFVLAPQEIALATSALDGSTASRRVRRIGLVGCDDSEDHMRAARHLVDDVGTPAILGFSWEVADVAGSLLIQRDVLAVASMTSDPQITRLPQPSDLPQMVFRTTYSEYLAAEVIATMVEGALEPAVKANARSRAPDATRVTLVRETSRGTQAFAEALYRRLRFNGKPAIDNGRDYQEVTFGHGALAADEIDRLAGKLASTAPTFVILIGDRATTVPLVDRLEARSGAQKPTYVAAVESTAPFAPFVGTSADRRRRVFAVDALSDSTANARFVMRYNATHPDQVTRSFNPGTSYDAFYLLAYATFALGDGAINGRQLACAFGRLVPPGRAIEVGPTELLDGLSEALHPGARSTSRERRAGSGLSISRSERAPSDFELRCSAIDGAGRATGADVGSGVVYRARSGSLEGTLRCP